MRVYRTAGRCVELIYRNKNAHEVEDEKQVRGIFLGGSPVNAWALEGWDLRASEELKKAHPTHMKRIRRLGITGE
jgi:hypothetical protein